MDEKLQEHFRTTELSIIPVKAKRTSKKKAIFNALLVILVVTLGVWITFKFAGDFSKSGTGGSKPFIEAFSEMNGWIFLGAFGILALILLTDALKYHVITKTATGGADFKISMKLVLMGRFYDSITPSSTGGQPMQIIYLLKKGYKGGEATAITMTKFFVQMFAWSFAGAILMIAGQVFLPTIGDGAKSTTLAVFAWVGFAMILSLPLMVIAFALFPKLTTKILCFFIKIGKKIHVVKDEEKLILKAQSVALDFTASFKLMCTRPVKFIELVLLSLLEPILVVSLPYIILLAFSREPFVMASYWQVMCLYMYAHNSAIVFAFSPGNSGAFEVTLLTALSGVSPAMKQINAWVIFSFRFITYYLNIITGLVMVYIDFILKKRKQKKDEELIFGMIVNRKPLELPTVYKDVAVLLSTYNGEKYLKEQIDSILNQKGVNVKLVVRDDGSTDKTIEILKQYESEGKLFKLILGEHIGNKNSFHELMLEAPKVGFYAFSSQDDIWDDEKLLYGVKTIERHPIQDIPLLYWTSLRVIDGSGKILKHYTIRPAYGDDCLPFIVDLHISDIKLCTCVINQIALDNMIKLTKNGYIFPEVTLQLMCDLFGNNFYDPVPHISYRSHDGNMEEVHRTQLHTDQAKLKFLQNNTMDNYYSTIANDIIATYEDDIKDEDVKQFLFLATSYKESNKNKLKLLNDKNFLPNLPFAYRKYIRKLIKDKKY